MVIALRPRRSAVPGKNVTARPTCPAICPTLREPSRTVNNFQPDRPFLAWVLQNGVVRTAPANRVNSATDLYAGTCSICRSGAPTP